jgi:hypothetical protein
MRSTLWCSILMAAVILVSACNPKPSSYVEVEMEALLAEARRLQCRMLELHQQSVALWDKATAELGQSLPLDMPADERRNMLAVRNTGLIQMFEVYPSLDTAIHRVVEGAGQQDEILATQMRAVKDSIDQNEEQLRHFLSQIQGQELQAYPGWKKRYDAITCE